MVFHAGTSEKAGRQEKIASGSQILEVCYRKKDKKIVSIYVLIYSSILNIVYLFEKYKIKI